MCNWTSRTLIEIKRAYKHTFVNNVKNFLQKQTKCVWNNLKLLQKSSPISFLVFILKAPRFTYVCMVVILSFIVGKYANKRTSVNNKIVFIGFDQVLQHLLHVQIKPDVIAK